MAFSKLGNENTELVTGDVLLVDLLNMSRDSAISLLSSVFDDARLIKIGYEFGRHDVKMIRKRVGGGEEVSGPEPYVEVAVGKKASEESERYEKSMWG